MNANVELSSTLRYHKLIANHVMIIQYYYKSKRGERRNNARKLTCRMCVLAPKRKTNFTFNTKRVVDVTVLTSIIISILVTSSSLSLRSLSWLSVHFVTHHVTRCNRNVPLDEERSRLALEIGSHRISYESCTLPRNVADENIGSHRGDRADE